MACPFFLPQGELETGPWDHTPRLPLGGAFSGVCHAQPGEAYQPPYRHQEELCNCGYARGLCERFPENEAADAVRFSVTREGPKRLRLVYILEKEHAPVEFGELEYSVQRKALLTSPSNAIIARQAQAFIGKYLDRCGSFLPPIPVAAKPSDHSERSACMTSTRAARIAGTSDAQMAEASRRIAEPPMGTAPGIRNSGK